MRAGSGIVSKRRHKKVLAKTKGFYGRAKNCYRIANNVLKKGMQYSYRDRKARPRNFRKLNIQRIKAAAELYGTKYSIFIANLKKNNIDLNRKVLAEMVVKHPEEARQLFEMVESRATQSL